MLVLDILNAFNAKTDTNIYTLILRILRERIYALIKVSHPFCVPIASDECAPHHDHGLGAWQHLTLRDDVLCALCISVAVLIFVNCTLFYKSMEIMKGSRIEEVNSAFSNAIIFVLANRANTFVNCNSLDTKCLRFDLNCM